MTETLPFQIDIWAAIPGDMPFYVRKAILRAILDDIGDAYVAETLRDVLGHRERRVASELIRRSNDGAFAVAVAPKRLSEGDADPDPDPRTQPPILLETEQSQDGMTYEEAQKRAMKMAQQGWRACIVRLTFESGDPDVFAELTEAQIPF